MYTSKDQIRVTLVINQWRIEGDMHVLSGSRLTDALNSKGKDYLALTDAKVFSLDNGQLLFEPPYLVFNRTEASVVFPS